MMLYDSDKPVNRRDTHSMKWDVPDQELPMWVADSIVPEEWYQAYMDWWKRRHGFYMEKDWLIFCTGVVPAISSIVRKLTTVGENVLIQTPVYRSCAIPTTQSGEFGAGKSLKFLCSGSCRSFFQRGNL